MKGGTPLQLDPVAVRLLLTVIQKGAELSQSSLYRCRHPSVAIPIEVEEAP